MNDEKAKVFNAVFGVEDQKKEDDDYKGMQDYVGRAGSYTDATAFRINYR